MDPSSIVSFEVPDCDDPIYFYGLKVCDECGVNGTHDKIMKDYGVDSVVQFRIGDLSAEEGWKSYDDVIKSDRIKAILERHECYSDHIYRELLEVFN
jgi:hypothetical protein